MVRAVPPYGALVAYKDGLRMYVTLPSGKQFVAFVEVPSSYDGVTLFEGHMEEIEEPTQGEGSVGGEIPVVEPAKEDGTDSEA